MRRPSTRRQVIRGTALTALTGLTASAGCLSSGGSSDGDEGDGQLSVTRSNETNGRPTTTSSSTPTATDDPVTQETTNTQPTDSPSTPEYIPLDEWVADSSNFDDTVERTDTFEVTVRVGAEGNGGHFAFDPPALLLRAHTTVTWEWTGRGGAHNIDFRDIDVDSGDPTDAEGTAFEYEFERPGTYLYACDPHRALGMKGGFVVVE